MLVPAGYERINPRRAIAGALLCWAGFVAVAVAMRAGWLAPIDRALLIAHSADSRTAEALRDITALGGVTLRLLFTLLAATGLLLLRQWRLAAWLGVTVAAGWLFETGLKLAFARVRPDLPHLMFAHGYSFPSGHSYNGTLVLASIALAFAPLIARQGIRVALLVGALVLGLAIAASRVWLAVHFPSDVAAGWLGGAGWAFGAAALIPFMAPAEARTVFRAD